MPTVYFSRRSRRAPTHVHDIEIDQRSPQESWHQLARERGYTYFGRDPRKRGNVYLRCSACTNLMYVHTHVLRTAQPECTACWLSDMAREAAAAGLEFVERHPTDSHRGIYRARCGHLLDRQRGFIQRVGLGEVDVRCSECFEGSIAAIACDQGWELVGLSEQGNSEYRKFRHQCGHEQDIAIGNLRTQRFACNGCGGSWAAEASFLYVCRFDLPKSRGSFVKLGMSKNPTSRLRYQMGIAGDIHAQILQEISMESGSTALRAEKRLHALLKAELPQCVVPASELNWIGVRSEVYRIEALPRIEALLSELSRQHSAN